MQTKTDTCWRGLMEVWKNIYRLPEKKNVSYKKQYLSFSDL